MQGPAGSGAGLPGENLGRREERPLRQESASKEISRSTTGTFLIYSVRFISFHLFLIFMNAYEVQKLVM